MKTKLNKFKRVLQSFKNSLKMQIYLLLSTAKHRELKLELSKPPKTQYFLDL